MTQAANTEMKPGLVLSTKEWQQLVLKHLNNPDIVTFAQEITKRVGEVQRVEDLNQWLGLAMNIWNTTPQPNRGGKTAHEMSREELRGLE